jgi:putative transcriptional regulator
MANKRLRKELVEGMQALKNIGAVDGATMRDFRDDLLSPPPAYSPDSIKEIRESFGVSQSVFAILMNVSVSTIQKWEQGQKAPSAPAYKLLDIVKNNGLGILIKENKS